MALVAYTFDRFGNVFKPGLSITPSIAPLVLVIVPLVITLVALAAIQVTERRRAKDKTTRNPPKPSFRDNHVVNPMHTADGARVQDEHKRMETRRRIQMGTLEDNSSMRSFRMIARRLFRLETAVTDDDENEGTAEDTQSTGCASRVCLRYSWQRRWWLALKGSHELLAIFMGRRMPGMGPSERLLIFIGCFYSNILGATILFHQYVTNEREIL